MGSRHARRRLIGRSVPTTCRASAGTAHQPGAVLARLQRRVLALAEEPGIPLLERVKFVAIFSSNLDEFFQVRVAALKDQVAAGVAGSSPDGLYARQQLAGSVRRRGFVIEQEKVLLDELVPELAERGHAARLDGTTSTTTTAVPRRRLRAADLPGAHAAAVDPAHPFPYISNLSLNLAVMVSDPDTRRAAVRPGQGARRCSRGWSACPTARASCRSSR